MTRGKRLPALAPGIYPDALGYEVRVVVKGKAFSKRFPPRHPLALMQAWQHDERSFRLRDSLDTEAQRGTVARGTLAGDVAHYLLTREGRAGYKADRSHLTAWTKAHGHRQRHTLTKHVCEKQIATWLKAGSSPKTIKHRVRVLRELWHALDGPRRTPLDGIKLPRIEKQLPAQIDDAVILAVGESLRAGLTRTQRCGPSSKATTIHRAKPLKTYARFLLYALSGQRPSQIGRAKPEHLDLVNRIWHVTSGKGGNPVPFPLSDQLEAAFVIFDAVDAWGSFNTRSFSLTLRRHGWPTTVRPYRLRHSFAIAQLLLGTDLGDIQGLLGHRSPTTTRIYAPVLVSRLKSAVERRPLTLVAK